MCHTGKFRNPQDYALCIDQQLNSSHQLTTLMCVRLWESDAIVCPRSRYTKRLPQNRTHRCGGCQHMISNVVQVLFAWDVLSLLSMLKLPACGCHREDATRIRRCRQRRLCVSRCNNHPWGFGNKPIAHAVRETRRPPVRCVPSPAGWRIVGKSLPYCSI